MRTINDCNFLFIAGVEGSGTTLTLRLLERLEGYVCLGGNHITKGYEEAGSRINELTKALWQLPRLPPQKCREIIAEINDIRVDGVETIIYKRSYPFASQYMPDLSDIQEIGNSCRIVMLRRYFFDNVNSILRRGMENDVDSALNRISHGYKHLYCQSQAAHEKGFPLQLIDYDNLVNDQTRNTELSRLAEFLGKDAGELQRFSSMVRKPNRNERLLQR